MTPLSISLNCRFGVLCRWQLWNCLLYRSRRNDHESCFGQQSARWHCSRCCFMPIILRPVHMIKQLFKTLLIISKESIHYFNWLKKGQYVHHIPYSIESESFVNKKIISQLIHFKSIYLVLMPSLCTGGVSGTKRLTNRFFSSWSETPASYPGVWLPWKIRKAILCLNNSQYCNFTSSLTRKCPITYS